MANKPSVQPTLNPVLSRPGAIRIPTSPPPRPVPGAALTKPRIFTPGIGLNLGT